MPYVIQEATLTNIADAVRGKTGGTEKLSPADMASAIGGISAGGGDIDALIEGSITELTSNAETVRAYAFYLCTALTTADFPLATSIVECAFYSCQALTTANFPLATSIDRYVFNGCTALTTANFPLATSIGNSAFNACQALPTADFPLATSIGDSAFMSCQALTTLVLRSETTCTLKNRAAFSYTPIQNGTGYIYVPRALVEDYKVATNWVAYATRFRALEDYTVDGTITGELDESKI